MARPPRTRRPPRDPCDGPRLDRLAARAASAVRLTSDGSPWRTWDGSVPVRRGRPTTLHARRRPGARRAAGGRGTRPRGHRRPRRPGLTTPHFPRDAGGGPRGLWVVPRSPRGTPAAPRPPCEGGGGGGTRPLPCRSRFLHALYPPWSDISWLRPARQSYALRLRRGRVCPIVIGVTLIPASAYGEPGDVPVRTARA